MTADRTKIATMMWDSHTPIIEKVAKDIDIEIICRSASEIERKGLSIKDVVSILDDADIVVMFKSNTKFWSDLEDELSKDKSKRKIVCFGTEPTSWSLTSVDHEIAINAYRYMLNSGEENFRRMFKYLETSILGKGDEILPPVEIPWQGIIHPDASDKVFMTLEEYLEWYDRPKDGMWVGIIASRPIWMMDGCRIEKEFVKHLEDEGLNVILIFTTFSKNIEAGALSVSEGIWKFFTDNGDPVVDAIVKFSTAFIGGESYGDDARSEVDAKELLESMNIPIYQPIVMSRMSVNEWLSLPGLTTDITWQIAFPEFEGVIEPLVIGSDRGFDDNGGKERVIIEERSRRLSKRIHRSILLGRTPNSEKKVVIFLNNFPCYGVEANVGAAAGLDTLESVANILKRMEEEGYTVEPPEDGKDLITRILENKALSEFRWTTIQEIDKRGGALYRMGMEEYNEYFHTLSEHTQNDVINMWGEPPGKGMVLDGELVITGVSFGNVIVAVQPKRGCYGSRCDGEVCKILHDPLCPPPHHFLATYQYYEHIWGAHAVIHTGTHGNMEWTPGKGVGMTSECYPDIAMSDSPHFYIYNSDNPPEGLVAKRRSYATLVDHMQNIMTRVQLYDGFSELENLLSQYDTASRDPTHQEQLKELIINAAKDAKFYEIEMDADTPLKECVRLCHEALSKVRNSQMNMGLHTFGDIPVGDRRVEMVNSIIRYGEEHDSIRDCVADIMELDLSELYKEQGRIDERYKISYGALIEDIGIKTRDTIDLILKGNSIEEALETVGIPGTDEQCRAFDKFIDIIFEISQRMDESKEIDALLNALDGGYTKPGPSGLITRGRYDILPTGRNFYSIDPHSAPNTTAWKVGMKLADTAIEKYLNESGEYPESIGFFWTMTEIVSTGGELMSQMMYLMGARPVWGHDGRVKDFEIMSLEELKRPRIDVTVNVSCILRDNMMHNIDLMDSIVSRIAELDEPLEMNYVRKHTLESITEGMDKEDAYARMFGAPPGSYISGVNLAVFASAWKEDKDLAGVFVKAKGHGYGNNRNGKPMFEQFAKSLSKVNMTFDKTASDEGDVLGCSCHFSNIGGMTVASRYLSGKDVKAYYGDTRDPRDIAVNTLADEIRRTMRTKVLNPMWIEHMKKHGYKGASEMMKRVSRLYGWEATTQEVDDWLFDEVTETFVSDEKMREFFMENNPYAFEELTRRLLEAYTRGLWNTDDETIQSIKDVYMDIESWLEEAAGEGEFQGGEISIITSDDVTGWNSNIDKVSKIIEDVRKRPDN